MEGKHLSNKVHPASDPHDDVRREGNEKKVADRDVIHVKKSEVSRKKVMAICTGIQNR